MSAHTENHHAHFEVVDGKDDLKAHEAQINITTDGDKCSIRLGFLQIRHVYQVRCTVPDSLGQRVTFDPLENLHVKIESATPTTDGHDLLVTFNAHKEKIVEESVSLRSEANPSKSLKLTFFARVLGKGKGTPSLKEGIHCIKVEPDDDSEASDWQGF